MKRWKVILAATLIFAIGIATGALSWQAVSRAFSPRPDPGLPPMMLDARFNVLQRMEKELELTPEQSRRIGLILEEGRKCTRALWDSVAPQMRDESRKVRDRIRAELTPEQRVKYEELIKRSREKRGPRPEGDGHPPKPGRGPGDPPPGDPDHPPALPPSPAPDSR